MQTTACKYCSQQPHREVRMLLFTWMQPALHVVSQSQGILSDNYVLCQCTLFERLSWSIEG